MHARTSRPSSGRRCTKPSNRARSGTRHRVCAARNAASASALLRFQEGAHVGEDPLVFRVQLFHERVDVGARAQTLVARTKRLGDVARQHAELGESQVHAHAFGGVRRLERRRFVAAVPGFDEGGACRVGEELLEYPHDEGVCHQTCPGVIVVAAYLRVQFFDGHLLAPFCLLGHEILFKAIPIEGLRIIITLDVFTLHFNEPYDLTCEVVPVVYITDDCLLADSMLAEKVVTRVAQFCETNDLLWNELQIDCDWRKSTRNAYFSFLEKARNMLGVGKRTLSATIRLHQFSQPAPPVDYGVLMCYNTGDLTDKKTLNAILSVREVRSYSEKLKDYPLPLTVAYPVFSWKRLFRGENFVALLRDTDIDDTTSFSKCGKGLYKVNRSFSTVTPDPSIFGLQLFPGDTVRYDFVPADTVLLVKQLLETQYAGLHKQVIIYSLNERDFSKYTQNEIESIYASCK